VSETGQLDLRLRSPKSISVSINLGGTYTPPNPSLFGPILSNPARARDPLQLPSSQQLHFGNRLTPELLSHFPCATDGGFMLDLGCGDGHCAQLCAHAGFQYIGVDHSGSAPTLLADIHALPFKDHCFEFLLSLAVLEHVRHPWLALREAHRVLRPGGTFIGSVAFLEPFHEDSYYHHSWLGLHAGLTDAGFRVERIAPNKHWTGLRALSSMALFPRLPMMLNNLLVAPLHLLHRTWWKVGQAFSRSPCATEQYRQLSATAGYRFVAVKP
jgi:SAM-dependent methyltransferase